MDYSNNTGGHNINQPPHQATYAQYLGSQPFKSKNKKIALIITVSVLGFLVLVGVAVFGILSILRNHPAHHAAQEFIRTSPEIIAVIGDVESFGFMPSGSVSTSPGHGDANFAITVSGSQGNARVYIELQRRLGGDWEVVRFNVVPR